MADPRGIPPRAVRRWPASGRPSKTCFTACVPEVHIRPMRDEDVVDADRVCGEVLYSTFDGELESVRAARQHARIRHLLSTDPGGSWVAESEGRAEGVGVG